jgi:ABC-2 type transport system permease protein
MDFFQKSWVLAEKEIKQYFVSPIAYVVMMVFLTMSGYFFYMNMISFSERYKYVKSMAQYYKNPEVLSRLNLNEMVIAPALFNMVFVFLFILPLIMMRALAEERKQKTEELLVTSPITSWQLIAGKFLGSLIFMAIMILPTVAYQIALFHYAGPEIGPVITGYFGVMLFVCVGISIGLFASSLTENQIIAATISFVIMLFMFIINMVSMAETSWIFKIAQYFTISEHLKNMLMGTIDTRDLVYFVSIIFLFLFMTKRSLESRGWR